MFQVTGEPASASSASTGSASTTGNQQLDATSIVEAKRKNRNKARRGQRGVEIANRTKKRQEARGTDPNTRVEEWKVTKSNRALKRSESDQSLIDTVLNRCDDVVKDEVQAATRKEAQKVAVQCHAVFDKNVAKLKDDMWSEARDCIAKESYSEGYKDGQKNIFTLYLNDKNEFHKQVSAMHESWTYHPLNSVARRCKARAEDRAKVASTKIG